MLWHSNDRERDRIELRIREWVPCRVPSFIP